MRETRIPRMVPGTAELVKVIQAPSGGIPARLGSAIGGSVECDVLDLNSSDELETTTETIDVFNIITVPVLTNGERLGVAALAYSEGRPDGYWVAIVDDCKDTGTA